MERDDARSSHGLSCRSTRFACRRSTPRHVDRGSGHPRPARDVQCFRAPMSTRARRQRDSSSSSRRSGPPANSRPRSIRLHACPSKDPAELLTRAVRPRRSRQVESTPTVRERRRRPHRRCTVPNSGCHVVSLATVRTRCAAYAATKPRRASRSTRRATGLPHDRFPRGLRCPQTAHRANRRKREPPTAGASRVVP